MKNEKFCESIQCDSSQQVACVYVFKSIFSSFLSVEEKIHYAQGWARFLESLLFPRGQSLIQVREYARKFEKKKKMECTDEIWNCN